MRNFFSFASFFLFLSTYSLSFVLFYIRNLQLLKLPGNNPPTVRFETEKKEQQKAFMIENSLIYFTGDPAAVAHNNEINEKTNQTQNVIKAESFMILSTCLEGNFKCL